MATQQPSTYTQQQPPPSQQQQQPPSPPSVPSQQQPPPVVMQQQQPVINPGAVHYYPQAQQQGTPQLVVGTVIQYEAPHYEYTPSSFRIFSLLTIVVCGLFSPLSLIFSIPAFLFSRKSENSAKLGSIKLARSQGMAAAYLNITAIIFASLMAILVIGLVMGLYGRSWVLRRCLDNIDDVYEDERPFYYSSYSLRLYC